MIEIVLSVQVSNNPDDRLVNVCSLTKRLDCSKECTRKGSVIQEVPIIDENSSAIVLCAAPRVISTDQVLFIWLLLINPFSTLVDTRRF